VMPIKSLACEPNEELPVALLSTMVSGNIMGPFDNEAKLEGVELRNRNEL